MRLPANSGKLLNSNNSRAVGAGRFARPKPWPLVRMSLRNLFKHGLKDNRCPQFYPIRSFYHIFFVPKFSEFRFKIWKIILKLGKTIQKYGKIGNSASGYRIDSFEASHRRLQTLPIHPRTLQYDSCAFQDSNMNFS